jgi:hypothetical protein
MRAQTITAQLGGKRRTMRTIVPAGMLALSLAAVALAATASDASARFLDPWYCPPPPTPLPTEYSEQFPERCLDRSLHPGRGFDFGDRQVGTTSPVQRFALVFTRSDVPQCSGQCPEFPQTFTPSISVSGDYAQTNDCPPTLSVQIRGCIITVTFAPTGTGPTSGTLSTGTDPAVAAVCGGCPAATGPTVKLTGRGVTRPTPPALPLLLSAYPGGKLGKKVTIRAITNNDSTVVAGGGVNKTKKRLAAGEETKFEVKLKHLKRLKRSYVENDMARVTFRFAATDEFGQTATEKVRSVFCRRVIPRPGPCDGH